MSDAEHFKKKIFGLRLESLFPHAKCEEDLKDIARKAGIGLDAVKRWWAGESQPSAFQLKLIWEQFQRSVSPGYLIFEPFRGKKEMELEAELKRRFPTLSSGREHFGKLDEIGRWIVSRDRVRVFRVDESDPDGAKRVLARCAVNVFIEWMTDSLSGLENELAKRKDHLRVALSGGSTIFEMADQIPPFLGSRLPISLHSLECHPSKQHRAIYPANEICCILHDRLKLERDRLELAWSAQGIREALNAHWAFVGIGTTDDDTTLAMLAEPDYVMSQLRNKYGAVADCLWILLDRQGTDRPDRESGFDPGVPRVELHEIQSHMIEQGRGLVGVSCGAEKKAEALLAHLNGNLLTGLIISHGLARAVLELSEADVERWSQK